MKSHGIFLCLGALTLSLGLATGCARTGPEAAAGSMEQQTTETVTGLREGTHEFRGRYLMTKNGDPMIITQKEGAVELFIQGDEEHMFSSLDNGDEIIVQLGLIRETYPSQADVFGVELVKKGSIGDIDQDTLDQLEEMGWIVQDKRQQLLYVGDRLYTGTGRPAAPACGTADGHITTVLQMEEIPGQDGQANFGSVGTDYIYLDEGAMAVRVEADSQESNAYQLFLSDDTVDYHGRFFRKADLSQETIEWLEFYNNLPEEGQRSISMEPPELINREHAGDSAVEETK